MHHPCLRVILRRQGGDFDVTGTSTDIEVRTGKAPPLEVFLKSQSSNLQSNLPMDPSRIGDLLDPFLDPDNGQRLTTNDLAHISTYIDILQRWNARVNLTAIRSEEEIVTRHFGESLFTARHLFPDTPARARSLPTSQSSAEAAERRENVAHGVSRGFSALEDAAPKGRKSARITLADLGSGAGFPGIPIKLWTPEIQLTLIESNHKKATFLREITRALTLTDVNIQNIRAESLTGVSFDVVALRAVERFELILPIAASLVSPGGRLAILIGQPQLAKAQSALATLTWSAPLPIPNSQSRLLVVATH